MIWYNVEEGKILVSRYKIYITISGFTVAFPKASWFFLNSINPKLNDDLSQFVCVTVGAKFYENRWF